MRWILFICLISTSVFSQNTKQIAYQYYINGEYKKAIAIYEELTAKYLSINNYDAFYHSLLIIEDYKKAINLSKKYVRKYPQDLKYQLGIIIAKDKSGNNSNIKLEYDKFFKRLDGGYSQAVNIARKFIKYSMYQKALDVYVLTEKKNNQNNFGIQKAELYAQLDELDLMLNEYLDVIEKIPNKKSMITSKIQTFLDNNGIKNDKNYDLVKKSLLRRVKLEKDRTDFSEMLIWLFMQNHQFNLALIQAKALDKRTKSDGEQVYNLAETFLDKEYFEIAIEGYDYVITKGMKNRFFIDANINRLYALTKQIKIKTQDLSILDNEYNNIITDLGKNRNTVLLFSNYAHFKAFYLHDLISAENLLIDAMDITGINKYDLAECKLEYADVLLLQGNIWQSILYYSQVEKDYKEHPLGHEAKLRIAKISYYQGDFQWAQAQLESLKASTSKLIANNAMELSLLITDNYNLDTTEISMKTFARAEMLHYQQKYDEALLQYDSILIAFNGHSLSDEIYMRKADIYLNNGDIENALHNYEKIEEDWSYDILADDALYKRAGIYDNILNAPDLAMELYEKILLEHNSSIYVAHSRKRFRDLRGDNFIEEK